jgi:predicted molibdopterin-dependent oxidoreductase YjgC
MDIETDSEEVRHIRVLSLELLLSDHRADCEAPCSMVCPKGLDVEWMLKYYDTGQYEIAYKIIAGTFSLPEIGCDTCKAPCEKACRRGALDSAVSIRNIIKEIAKMPLQVLPDEETRSRKVEKNLFQSHLGRFGAKEKEKLKTTVTTPSRCLHCACAGKADCKLRLHATSEGIKRPRYEASSTLPVMDKQQINENMWFEQAKCIRCGLCVYNTDNGFTFKGRGFGMQVMLPEENRKNVKGELAKLCPTGAIYLIQS